MSSKERVKRTWQRQMTDRVPINYFANPGIDHRLKEYFGLQPDDDEGLRIALGIDFRCIAPSYKGPRLHPEIPHRQVNPIWGWVTRWVEHGAGGYWDYCDFPLAGADAAALAAWPLPDPDDFAYEEVTKACRRWEDYAIVAGNPGLGDIINSNGFLFGTEEALVRLAADDEYFLRFVDRRLDIQLEITRRTLEAGDGNIDLLWIGEDLGTQRGPLISHELFCRHILPRHQRFIDLAKRFGVPAMLHSCGSSSWAFPDFIKIGLSAVDTLQPDAVNMSPLYLKRNFGDKLIFHGCISTAGVLAFGGVAETVEHCRHTLEIMMPGGGYCFAPTHCLQDNTPTANAVAMYETAHRLGHWRPPQASDLFANS